VISNSKINSKVTSISGKTINRNDSIKIRDKYHEKNVDCFRINEKWVSSHYNNLAFDEATQAFNFASRLHPVLVSNSADFKETSIGFSSKIYGESFALYDRDSKNEFYAYSQEQYESLSLKLCETSGLMYPKGTSPFKKTLKYNRELHDFKFAVTLPKAISAGMSEELIETFGLTTKNYNKTAGYEYSFGVEIETSGGVIPKNIANGKLNIDYVYDGSVFSKNGDKYGGGEIVTGVLNGTSGVNHLKTILAIAENRCVVNPTCGLHVHVGGFKPTNEFVVNAYLLGLLLQTDIFTYLPKKRRMQLDYQGNITGNENIFCKFLHNLSLFNVKDSISPKEFAQVIDENYNLVFQYISGGRSVSDNCSKHTDHPQGTKCGYDKNSLRYCWLNLVPTIFNTRKNKTYTLEFRPFPETLCFTKTYYWLLFCLAFVHFCENYTSQIYSNKDDNGKPLSLLHVLDKAYGKTKLGQNLRNYYEARKQFFSVNHGALEQDFINYQKCV